MIIRKRIFQPDDHLLFTYPIGQNVAAGTSALQSFIVTTPSARVMTKFAIIFWQYVTGQPSAIPNYFDAGLAGKIQTNLYLAAADKNEAGNYSIITNLAGTIGPVNTAPAYQRIPTDEASALGAASSAGYALDVQSTQDALIGTIRTEVLGANMGVGHHGMNISLRARYELVGAEMCDEEWIELRTLMSISAQQAKVML